MRRPSSTMMHRVRLAVCVIAMTNASPTSALDDSCSDPSSPSALTMARRLEAPAAADTQDAEFEHAAFWDDHGPLLKDAWEEWEEHYLQTASPLSTTDAFLDPSLAAALDEAFGNPSEDTEAEVKALWTSSQNNHAPLPKGVYQTQLLSPSGIRAIRELLDWATASGIPTRRPNGMNRHGVIVDPDVHGAVNVNSLVQLVEEELIERVARPVGRMLFPDRVGCGDDEEYFAFTIRYDGSDDEGDDDGNASKRDVELKEHRDASIVTLNVNLNLLEEGFYGSEVFFRDYPSAGDVSADGSSDDGIAGTARFTPGMALIHLGAHRHGALPISSAKQKSGKRYNLIIWLFGKDGDVRIAPYEKDEQMSVAERWQGCNETEVFSFN